MPLWEIFHSMEAFKGLWDTMWLAGNITDLYVKVGLPALYVNVLFFPMAAGNFFVGANQADKLPQYGGDDGALRQPSVRISIQHLAIHCGNNQIAIQEMLDRIDHDNGYAWEYYIKETDPATWEINGLRPPKHGSEEERQWARDGHPSPPAQ